MSEKETVDRRQMLKRAAIKLACRNGYERTTIKQIARECGVTVGVIYHYFDSKEALFREALVDHFPDAVNIVPELAALPVEEGLVRMAERLVENLRQRGDAISVILSECSQNPQILGLFIQVVTQIRALIREYFEQKMMEGELARQDARILVNQFFGHFFTAYLHKERMGMPDLPELDEQFIRQSVKTMIAGWKQGECV